MIMADFNALVAARAAAKKALAEASTATAELAAQWSAATGALNIPGAHAHRIPAPSPQMPPRGRPIPPHLAALKPGPTNPAAEVPTVPIDVKALQASLAASAPAPVASKPVDLNALAAAYGAAVVREAALKNAYETTVRVHNDAVSTAGG